MGFQSSRVAPRENWEATKGTTRVKEKRPHVSPLGAHLNNLWEWSGPSMLGFGVQTNTTLRPEVWDGCEWLGAMLPT